MFKRRVRRAARAVRTLVRGENVAEAQAFLAAAVQPSYYAAQAGLQAKSSHDDLVAHFLSKGLAAGLSPSPLFPARPNDATSMRSRILDSRKNGPAEGWFDVGAYEKAYPDVAAATISPFEHFLQWGLVEGRSPNPLFDARWFAESYRLDPHEPPTPAFLRYLGGAAARGYAPSLSLLPIFAFRTASSGPEIERFSMVARAARPWLERLGAERFALLAGLFYAPGYDGAGALDADADGPRRFAHFLSQGLGQGLDPGPLFEAALYKPPGAPNLSAPGAALLHFLEHGERAAAPTRLVDEAAYRRRNADFPARNFWAFRHLVTLGLFEGRSVDDGPRASVHVAAADAAGRALANWRRFWGARDANTILDPEFRAVVTAQRRITAVFASSTFHETMRRAIALDPSIGDVSNNIVVAPPAHDPREASRLETLRRLPRLSYDAIICVPWLRNGGADLVACLLADAVASDATRRVLMLRVDQPHFERPDWVPANVDVVHISDVIGALTYANAEEFFYTLLLGLAPKQVFNVNSNLCWRVFARYGARLSRSMDLYSYLFCWDHDAKGNRVGYPSDFFAPTAPHLAGIFTDTRYLRDELFKMHLPPADVRERVTPLFSPVRETPADSRVIAEVAALRPRARPRVVWAGRLDPQKRFDLVLDAARAMPDVDFECWGGAVLGEAIDHDPPPNLKLNGFFKGYDELRLDDADAWLFTSDWEGMPTLIIELGIRGAPIVASAVGGVPELIDSTTGYPVPGGSEACAYVAALRQAIGDPQERVKRATRLQERTRERHTREAYLLRLTEILSKGR